MTEETKRGVGRPTKYSEQTLIDAAEYCLHYHEQTDSHEAEVIPTIVGLSLWLNITKPTVYDWAKEKDKPEFSYLVSKIMGMAEQKLVGGGLKSTFNASITKLMLTKHGYSDAQRIDGTLTGDGLKPEEKAKLLSLLKPDAQAVPQNEVGSTPNPVTPQNTTASPSTVTGPGTTG